MRVVPRAFPLDLAGLTVGLSTLAILYGGFRAFYYGGDFLASFSYVSNETVFNEIVNAWIGRDPQETLFGIHAFGDYVILNVWASFPDPWGQLEQVNYPPPILLVYRLLGFLPYDVGFWLYMAGLVIGLLAPMVIATRSLPFTSRVLLISTLAVLTGPAISTLDRGNSQGLLPVIFFCFAIAIMKQRWGWAASLIAVAAAIKIYPIALILLLLALRKYRWAAASIGMSIGAVLLTLPLMSTAGLAGLPVVVGDILQWQERDLGTFLSYNVSLAGGLANGAMFLGFESMALWIASNPLVVAAVYGAFVIPLLWSRRIELWLRVLLVLSLPTTLMPIVYPYALNWILAASAFAVWIVRTWADAEELRPLISRLLLLTLAVGTALLPIFIPGSAESGRPAGVVSLAAVVVAVGLPVSVWLSRSRRQVPNSCRSVVEG